MTRVKSLPEEPCLFGHGARWAAAPYCEFKDDRARLHALIARDIRMVCIACVFTLTGVSVPWDKWLGLLS